MARAPHLAGIAFLLAAVLFGAWVRVATALGDPGFDAVQAEGMLRSDPALIYYFTERILAGADDLRADPRVEHPGATDLPATFTLGQEYLVAWTYGWFGGDAPLHVHATRVMALVASLAAVGVYLLVLARTRSPLWASLGVALFVLLPANYRTIGFVLIREDLSLPLFALHLGLFARAVRVRTPAAALLAGVPLAAALATWHAMTFLVGVEAFALVALYVARGSNPLGAPASWIALVPVVAAGVLVPALLAKAFVLSLPVQLGLALVAAGLVERRRPLGVLGRAGVCLVVAAGVALCGLGLARWTGGGVGDLRHVYEVLLAKVVHLGRPPDDPNAISFNARLLWQGPFETLELRWGAEVLLGGLCLAAVGFVCLLRGGRERDPADAALLLFAALSLPLAWLIARMMIVPGLILPAVAATLCAERSRTILGIFLAILLGQALLFARFLHRHEIYWYQPAGQRQEIAELVRWIPEHLPEGEPIAADFVNSTAILAHTGRPIVLQPKYETEKSRRRAEAFLTAFFHGTPDELRALVRERFGSEYLLVDRLVLGRLSPWTAGLPAGRDPAPGTPAALLVSRDAEVLTSVPGFELVYRSPETILQPHGAPFDLFRVYRLAP